MPSSTRRDRIRQAGRDEAGRQSTQQHAGVIPPGSVNCGSVVLFLPHLELFGTRLDRSSTCLRCCDEFCGYDEFYSGGWVVMKKSLVLKRSIVVGGHKTSVSLEDEFWAALKKIAVRQHATLSDLVGSIDSQRQHGNLSSAVRLFVLNHYRQHVEVQDVWSAASETRPGKGTE
jgi:predicted DNA-binding ribbon-helix-helix protein